MPDPVDLAESQIEINLANSLYHSKKSAAPKLVVGTKCHNCDAPVEGTLFCLPVGDGFSECQTDYQRRTKRARSWE